MTRFSAGDHIPDLTLTTADGHRIDVPDPGRLVHLQFRRYAGCPVCNLHLRSIATRHDEILVAGVREVVVFHSSADELRPYSTDLPFETVPDPERDLYRTFGVEKSIKAVLRPSVVKAALAGFRPGALKEQLAPGQSHLGLPADFLIDVDGTIIDSHYGEHAADQWSVDDLLAVVAAHATT